MAGLIDNDGHFSTQLVITFHEKDSHLACLLKEKIGYGIISKLKNKRAITFVIPHSLGLERVCALVHNKLQHLDKITQYNSRLSSLKGFKLTEKTVYSLKDNSWFAGFLLGGGSFQIKVIKRAERERLEVRAVIQIDQKTDPLLLQIQKDFGGFVGKKSSLDTFYYSSVFFDLPKRLVQYFDNHHLRSSSE